MIRENTLFCKLLQIKKSARQLYRENSSAHLQRPMRCCVCGCRVDLRTHDSYARSLIDREGGKTVYAVIQIRRVLCTGCGHTHACLPDYVVPYSTYSLFFILRVLAAYFLKLCSVERLCRSFAVSASMLYRWRDLFLEHKTLWLGVLASAVCTPAAFLLRLAALPNYADAFGAPFFRKTARSFLQGHRDAARFRRAVF